MECAGATASSDRDKDSFTTVPTGVSYPMFSDSICVMSHTLYSDSTGFYSCDDKVIFGESSGAPQFPQKSNRATLPPNVFVIEGDLASEGNKDGNGRVRSLPIISQEESESDSSSFWQQLVLHGLESTDRSPDDVHRSQDEGHNIIYPSVHLSLRQNAIPYTSHSNDDVNPSAGRLEINDDDLGASQAASTGPGHQISIDPLSTLDANSIMNEVQVSIPHTNPLISIPRPHEVLPPPEPTFDETIVAGPSSSSSEEAVSEGASSEGAASEGAASEGATSEGSGASVLMPLMEIREEVCMISFRNLFDDILIHMLRRLLVKICSLFLYRIQIKEKKSWMIRKPTMLFDSKNYFIFVSKKCWATAQLLAQPSIHFISTFMPTILHLIR